MPMGDFGFNNDNFFNGGGSTVGVVNTPQVPMHQPQQTPQQQQQPLQGMCLLIIFWCIQQITDIENAIFPILYKIVNLCSPFKVCVCSLSSGVYNKLQTLKMLFSLYSIKSSICVLFRVALV